MRISDWSSDVCSSDLFGHCRSLSGRRRQGGRRGGRDRPDAVELCARRAHGGFHGTGTIEIDGMNDEQKVEGEAKELPEEASGETKELDRLAELEKELEGVRQHVRSEEHTAEIQ